MTRRNVLSQTLSAPPSSHVSNRSFGWRRTALAAAIALVAGAGSLSAQTVVVMDAPAGGTVDLVVNNAVVVSDAANANGRVTLIVPGANRADMDAHVAVDSCGARRRILITQPSVAAAAPDAACVRRDVTGLFLVRSVSTIVFHVEGANPRLLLRQGAFNPDAPPRTWEAVPSGLMVSGGVAYGAIGHMGTTQCGTTPDCTSDTSGFALGGGAEFWFGRYVALEFGYLKPPVATADGLASGYRFTSDLDVRIFTLGAKVGAPVGPVRIYGRGGVNRHRALTSISETIDDRTTTVDEVTTTIPGGTQAIELQTEGYGWYFGGGVELWLSRYFAPYVGFDYQKIKGDDTSDGEGKMDDRHLSVGMGLRLRLWK